MANFLSNEWFRKCETIYSKLAPLSLPEPMLARINVSVTDNDEIEDFNINEGVISSGSLSDSDLNIAMTLRYAKEIILMGRWSFAMTGYLQNKIKFTGQFQKALALAGFESNDDYNNLIKEIQLITTDKESKL